MESAFGVEHGEVAKAFGKPVPPVRKLLPGQSFPKLGGGNPAKAAPASHANQASMNTMNMGAKKKKPIYGAGRNLGPSNTGYYTRGTS